MTTKGPEGWVSGGTPISGFVRVSVVVLVLFLLGRISESRLRRYTGDIEYLAWVFEDLAAVVDREGFSGLIDESRRRLRYGESYIEKDKTDQLAGHSDAGSN